jgi:hypothetical protein
MLLNKTRTESTGRLALFNPQIFNDNYQWWKESVPDYSSGHRLSIPGSSFNEVESYLKEIDITRWTRTKCDENNFMNFIIMSLNIYAVLKASFPEDAPKTDNNKLITYRVDYFRIIDDRTGYHSDFDGRCVTDLDSTSIRSLIYDISIQNWSSFWIKISIIYESIFTRINDILEDPPHLRVKHIITNLEREYIVRV